MQESDHDTLRMLRDAASTFAGECANRFRKSRKPGTGYDRSAWREIAEQGWLAALIPEGLGGLGLGNSAVNVIASEAGRAALVEPYVTAGVMPTVFMSVCQSRPQLEKKITAIASGELICALAWQDISGSLEAQSTPLTATRVGNDIILDGQTHYVMVDGLEALIAIAHGEHGLEAYWVSAPNPQLNVVKHCRADWSFDTTVSFNSVKVPASNCLASGHEVTNAMHAALNTGLVATAAELNGLSEKMVEMTLNYLRTRQQFGRQIGSFQALKHRAVDLWMHSEISKEATLAAAKALDGDSSAEHLSASASGAKARASDTALLIGKQAVQMHGAIGITDEYDLSLYFNRAIVLSAYLGNSVTHRSRYAHYKKY